MRGISRPGRGSGVRVPPLEALLSTPCHSTPCDFDPRLVVTPPPPLAVAIIKCCMLLVTGALPMSQNKPLPPYYPPLPPLTYCTH
eukprot:8413172-Pyramimonas_sp.AAC.1